MSISIETATYEGGVSEGGGLPEEASAGAWKIAVFGGTQTIDLDPLTIQSYVDV